MYKLPEKLIIQAQDDHAIHTYRWQKEKNIEAKAIIQIAHGMAEHILRYDAFASFLTKENYIVYGHNHRGHGADAKIQGYFSKTKGFEKLVDDMKLVTDAIKETHPNLPIILFGHSMGSFITRRYIQRYGDNVDGVILSGTGGDQGFLGKIGLQLAIWQRKRIGASTPSPFMDKLVFGSYNKKFTPHRTPFDFLSRDDDEVDKYVADPLCGFVCTSGFFVDLISGIEKIHQQVEVSKTPRDLPIHLIAGDKDPVGNYGKGVQQVYKTYKKIGCHPVTLQLYEGARHELLNERNKEAVYEDILHWLHTQLGGRQHEED